MSNRLFNAGIELRPGEKNWQRLIDALQVRHRITHPKDLAAFDVTDAELETCKEVCHWFNDVVVTFLGSTQAANKRSESKPNGADSR